MKITRFWKKRGTPAVSGSRRISRDALDGLPHEKFLRLVGLFHAVVPATRKGKDQDGRYVDPTVQEFRNLCSMIEERLAQNDKTFQRNEMGDYVHNLNLLFGQLMPVETLDSAVPAIRDDYRARVSAEAYGVYTGSHTYKMLTGCDRASDPEARVRWLRADYIQLINEIRRLTLLEYHIEETRSYLIRKLRLTLFKLIFTPVAIVLLFLTCRTAMHHPLQESHFLTSYFVGDVEHPTTLYRALHILTLLSLAAIAGAVGSFISALLRIESVPENNEIARNVVALRYSESVRLAPVTGFVFAILLSFVFGGQLLNGQLFPKTPPNGNWPELLSYPAELAKWLVWAFIVGFAERLMPDMIDRLVDKAGKSAQVAAPGPMPGGRTPVFANGSAGGNGDGTGKSRHFGVRPKRPAPVKVARAHG